MDLRDRLLTVARSELARVGPAALSMRAIARELNLTVGALYRYVDGRDALLTELVSAAYCDLGASVERAATGGPRERWCAAWREFGLWAHNHPHEFDLLYGTPVIGYAAPESTIQHAMRVPRVLFRCLDEADSNAGVAHAPSESKDGRRNAAHVPATLALPPTLCADLDGVIEWAATECGVRPTRAASLGVIRAWTELIGTLSFAAHGHFVGSVEHTTEYFDWLIEAHADALGLR